MPMKRLLLLSALLLGLWSSLQANAAETKPLNVVVIFIDDMGYGDLGCYGGRDARTPNIDRLAEEGTRFTSFYAKTVCGPSRGALMTGR